MATYEKTVASLFFTMLQLASFLLRRSTIITPCGRKDVQHVSRWQGSGDTSSQWHRSCSQASFCVCSDEPKIIPGEAEALYGLLCHRSPSQGLSRVAGFLPMTSQSGVSLTVLWYGWKCWTSHRQSCQETLLAFLSGNSFPFYMTFHTKAWRTGKDRQL